MSSKHAGGNALMNLEQQPKPKKILTFGEDPLQREKPSVATQSSVQAPPPPPTTPYHLPPPPKQPTAPERDFARVPNSVNRDALPGGLFKGTSKKLYDALYQRTRGAMKPSRTIKATHGDLMNWAGVSHNTLREHLRHLARVGLVVRQWEVGDNAGAVYEVFIPEETTPPTTSYHPLPTPSTSQQKLVGDSNQNLVGGGGGQVAVESTTSVAANTIKDIDRSDDEALAGLVAKFRQVNRELTGRTLSAGEQAKWDELADLLISELRIAAARTSSLSSVPAFLTEHLRRRLWKKDKAQLEAESREVLGGVANVPADASGCLDCGGSGWWYPDGPEKGVARCRHVRLPAEERS